MAPENTHTNRCRRAGCHLPFKKGMQLEEVEYRDPLLNVTVDEVMVKNVDLFRPDMTLERLIGFIEQNPHMGFPVVNAQGELLGMFTYAEVHQAFSSGPPSKNVLVQEIMRKEIPVIYPHESLARPFSGCRRFGWIGSPWSKRTVPSDSPD